MAPWYILNSRGKILYVACLINLCVSVIIANAGDWTCLFSVAMALLCAINTFNTRYQHKLNDE